MATVRSPQSRARRSLLALGIIALVIAALNTVGFFFAGGTFVPKLGLDLVGGTQIILQPQTQGGKAPTAEQLAQSVTIIRQRVAAAGVPDAQIAPTGGSNIVVSIPDKASDATIATIRESAAMTFRPVLLASTASTSSASSSATPYTPAPTLRTTPTASPTSPSDLSQVTPYLQALYTNFDCAQDVSASIAKADEPLVTCSSDGSAKYLLGPVEIEGKHIKTASAGIYTTSSGASTGEWVVNLSFDAVGTKQFATVTTRLVSLTSPRNQFAILLDGKVIEAPATQTAIPNGQAMIQGSFTEDSAKALADKLKFGALPVSFEVQSINTISATLGSQQLQSGLLAGLVGLILVIVYSALQYRALAVITVGSLAISAVFTYLVVDFLSWREGYRLSLAGVAGLVVSIGITADSFIVYFERIRDELREGRTMLAAVEHGWRRAFRTVIASDTVNFLAAAILFVLAIGDVQGFALTLGLTTLIDVMVVALFTHPMLLLLTRVPFFAGGHRFSGLDPEALGAVYRGRAQFRTPAVQTGAVAKSRGEAQRRQTIAERKAAELEAAKQAGKEPRS